MLCIAQIQRYHAGNFEYMNKYFELERRHNEVLE